MKSIAKYYINYSMKYRLPYDFRNNGGDAEAEEFYIEDNTGQKKKKGNVFLIAF